jgi:hypothetical protein
VNNSESGCVVVRGMKALVVYCVYHVQIDIGLEVVGFDLPQGFV